MSLEHILRVPLDTFTDRDTVLALVKRALGEAQAGQLHLLSVKGSSGVGKTSLLSYIAEYICPQLHWQPVLISFALGRPDFRAILSSLETVLEAQAQKPALAIYRARKEEIELRYQKNRLELINKRQRSQPSSSERLGRNDELGFLLWAEVQQWRTVLSHALCQLASQSTTPLCILIDDYDHLLETEKELVGWLWEDLLGELTTTVSYPIAAIVCGRQWATNDAKKHGAQGKLVEYEAELANFDLFQVKNYLTKKHVLGNETPLAEQGELISFFYEVTQGHPLSLELALVYFKSFEQEERRARTLRAHVSQGNERTYYLKGWLERLLTRLPEPHRTLLERGPILRTCNQQTLQVLLDMMSKGAPDRSFTLDEQTYRHFLFYPFFNQPRGISNREIKPAFHALLRRVRLQMLRQQQPQLHEQLQRAMMDYYGSELLLHSRELIIPVPQPRVRKRDRLLRWLLHESPSQEEPAPCVLSLEDKVEAPDDIFEATIEYLYHILQIKEMQARAFAQWKLLLERVIESGQRRRVGQLWELVRQLSTEDESFLKKPAAHEGYLMNHPYMQYNQLYTEYVEYETRIFGRPS